MFKKTFIKDGLSIAIDRAWGHKEATLEFENEEEYRKFRQAFEDGDIDAVERINEASEVMVDGIEIDEYYDREVEDWYTI